MVIAIIVILFAIGLFLVLHDDHDNSYTKNEKKPTRQRDFTPAQQKPAVSQGNTPRPARFAETVREMEKAPLDFHFLDQIEYHAILPERTMSSFIAGLQGHCTDKDLGKRTWAVSWAGSRSIRTAEAWRSMPLPTAA